MPGPLIDIVPCVRQSLFTHRWHGVVQHFRHRLIEFLDLTIPASTVRVQPVNEHNYNIHTWILYKSLQPHTQSDLSPTPLFSQIIHECLAVDSGGNVSE